MKKNVGIFFEESDSFSLLKKFIKKKKNFIQVYDNEKLVFEGYTDENNFLSFYAGEFSKDYFVFINGKCLGKHRLIPENLHTIPY